LLLSLPEGLPLLLELPLLFPKTRGLRFGLEALLSELLLFALKTVVLGPGTGKVAPPVETIALLAALVPRG
jgi:hypothetical protein